MKLLKKLEVDQQKARERQREIEEGAKIAGRVDTLREVHATEEASLEKFRRETVARISEEIAPLAATRDALKDEVRVLEEKREAAKQPLDKEKKEIGQDKDVLEDLQTQLEFRKLSLDTLEENLNRRDKEVTGLEKRLAFSDSDVKRRLREVAMMEENASIQKEKVREMASRTLEEKSEQDDRYTLLESEHKERMRALSAREIASNKRDQDLTNRERALKDKYETFLRATVRFNKSQGKATLEQSPEHTTL